jgi:hypothetical protein
VLKTEKKAAVAEAMQLSETESAPFWELYNEFNAELYKVHTERVNIIKDFAANIAVLAASACSILQVTSDYDKETDFSQYKTFEYYGWAEESDKVLNQ